MPAFKLPASRPQRYGVIALIVLALLALALWIGTLLLRPHFPTPAEISGQMHAQAALTGGEKIFVARCAYCHTAKIGPQLGGLKLPAAAVAQFVRRGIGPMPAVTPAQISDADLKLLGDYVSKLPKPETAQ